MNEKRKLTEEDILFLGELSNELLTQGTYGNADPRFFTVRDVVEEPCWAGNSEYWLIVDEDGEEVGTVDYEVDAGQLGCVPMHKRRAVVEDTLFLTHREAAEHIKMNRHHYTDPHPYVQTALRSPQFERLISILKEVDWTEVTAE